MRVAVVGHVEWVTFAPVDRFPAPGEILHAKDVLDLPAGGGPVAAVQLARLAGGCDLYTALGDDELGHRSLVELERLGLRVHATFRAEPQRRAFTLIDATGERTIVVIGSRLGPRASDPLPWDDLAQTDAVYFCAGDDDALRAARRARVLVATLREHERLARVDPGCEAVCGSASDPSEPWEPGSFQSRLVVRTEGRDGGRYEAGGRWGRYAPAALPGPIVDTYGGGDSFVGALTYALAAGLAAEDALALAARAGAACITGRGPYEGQLTRPG
ncbi:MAG TPA: PfkB family carbohydrate kinase [Actinomycetota bacterium]|nr:PfkB family carbohydrate kinase [Actinomycetota bacterium]